MKDIILIAPPAAGKGTQAALIKQYYNIPHISTGDLLRLEVKKKGSFSDNIKDNLDKGHLVSDEVVLSLLKQRIKQDDCKNGFILDGFPRNIDQAKQYDILLNDLNIDFSIVILIDINIEIAKNRILGRLLCPKCGKIYNVSSPEMKPKADNICDNCQSQLIKRSDDNINTYEIRYSNYLEKTAPLIDYYQQRNVLHRVDGNHSSEYTFIQINEILKRYL